ncbi:DEAD/DEAH box helicase family protein [Nocardia sp. NEAU-G5]|uniref:DEAD/DEAH box helicase family protein n=1 Tax=Nocardia albiluteola TaxID=2842303 RepID=A0ABS6AZS6_9NOCA|nr:DEAD/DEAH box helicase family protein [Nocardia albiluteola]MBU3063562.1 DEAD/DEAH box helicase family protein [Nocardia albiluteola]
MSSLEPGLRSLPLDERYRSDRQDVVSSFYLPAFDVATSYSRAVGYFTSTSLALFARGVDAFAARGGIMRLIASPHLNEDDIVDIERGYDRRQVIERATLRELDTDQHDTILDGLGLIGRLIAEGRLDIKLAFVEHSGRIGIYHEKIGIFRDAHGDLVAFTGSSNETYGGLIANFESVEVYRSWLAADSSRAQRIDNDFQALWSNRTAHLTVEPFPDVARERLIALSANRPGATVPAHDDALTPHIEIVSEPARLEIPHGLTVRDYQRKAVESWLGQRGRGMLKMATGTGKTKTAMIAATKLASVLRTREEPLILLVVAPQQHLVDQWITEIETFGVHPIGVYESSQKWIPAVDDQLNDARLGQRPVVALVATNASFSSEKFQAVLSRITQPLLLVADEAHNLGSPHYRRSLPPNATYRLALSATPERWFDDDGTSALTDYFGATAFELGIGQAIDMGALCRYTYTPRLVELNGDETALYLRLTNQIAKRLAAGDSIDGDLGDSPIGNLLRQRTAVLGHAAGKLAQLRSDLTDRKDSSFQLIYCAEGSRPTEPGEPPGPSQLKDVLNMVGNELRIPTHSYVHDTLREERKRLLHRFTGGNDLRVLVAMRCLDEGVDIPDARTGYLLASSSNPRQFIQRRGRLLRPAEGKARAEILDYLAVPPPGAPVNFSVERRLLSREFERANEFSKLSENYETTLQALRPLKERYHLRDM